MKKILNLLAKFFYLLIFLRMFGNLFCAFVLERISFRVFQVFLMQFFNRLKHICFAAHECLSLIFHCTFYG